jgi:formate dehydrogenase subunit beta
MTNSDFSKIDVKDEDLSGCLQGVFKTLLESDRIDALLVPWRLPMDRHVMPTLITDPEDLTHADPLAPSFPINAAKVVSRLTKRPYGEMIGVVMRPCEIRAFIELIKLKQGELDPVVIISLDCLGAFSNTDFAKFTADDANESTRRFYQTVLDKKADRIGGIDLARACRVCEHPVSKNADVTIGLYGVDYKDHLVAQALTPKGEAVIRALGLKPTAEPAGRKQTIKALVADRIATRDAMFESVSKDTSSIEKLSAYLAGCVNCYNCRVACPVCYCKECVFVTDVFDHDPYQYMQWAKRKGRMKMPTDTDFFHLTRMAHIGLTCVGCGQCSNACPNEIPLMELFRTIAHRAQAAFDYEAGSSVDDPLPLSIFEDEEYEEVVGVVSVSGQQ